MSRGLTDPLFLEIGVPSGGIPGMEARRISQDLTILLVADEFRDGELTRKALVEAGAQNPILLVRGAEEAGQLLFNSSGDGDAHPGLILLELDPDGTSILELLRQIREEIQLRPIPLVVLSRNRVEGMFTRCYRLGANSCLIKPVSYERLVEMTTVLLHYWFRIHRHPARSHASG